MGHLHAAKVESRTTFAPATGRILSIVRRLNPTRVAVGTQPIHSRILLEATILLVKLLIMVGRQGRVVLYDRRNQPIGVVPKKEARSREIGDEAESLRTPWSVVGKTWGHCGSSPAK